MLYGCTSLTHQDAQRMWTWMRLGKNLVLLAWTVKLERSMYFRRFSILNLLVLSYFIYIWVLEQRNKSLVVFITWLAFFPEICIFLKFFSVTSYRENQQNFLKWNHLQLMCFWIMGKLRFNFKSTAILNSSFIWNKLFNQFFIFPLEPD